MTRPLIILACLFMTTATIFAESPKRRIFLPSRFSHDMETGEQLIQHTPRPEPFQPNNPTYVKAGFTYNRYVERNQNGTSAVHVQLESWGHPYRSYTPRQCGHYHSGWRW